MANFELAVTKTLNREGGAKVTRTSQDKGGVTKYGISQTAYLSVVIESLTEEDAKRIYKTDYWDKIHGDEIRDQAIAEDIFDTAVNMGTRGAVKLAQLSLDVAVDGVVGPKTLGVINEADPAVFLPRFILAKIARYAHICNSDPTQSKFLLGWINRALGA